MTVTVSQLGERALRRLGVSVVPVADRPLLNTSVSPSDIANNALVELGIIATDEVPLSQATVVATATIATTALQKLGVIAADETPIAADQTLAQTTVQAVHSSLVAQGICDWTSSAITDAVSEEYAGLTAFHLASAFGKPADPAVIALLEGRIATVARVIRAKNLALAKVTEVQASLASQASVSWPNTGIPMAVAEEYTRLVAMSLASSFGKQVDPQMLPIMEARVRRMAQVLAAPESAENAVMAVHDNLVARGVARWTSQDIPGPAEMPYEQLAANRLAPLFDKQINPAEEMLANRALAQIVALEPSGRPVRVDYF